jgi:hypothetical protein
MKFLLDVIAYSIFCHFSVKFEAGGDTLSLSVRGKTSLTSGALQNVKLHLMVDSLVAFQMRAAT